MIRLRGAASSAGAQMRASPGASRPRANSSSTASHRSRADKRRARMALVEAGFRLVARIAKGLFRPEARIVRGDALCKLPGLRDGEDVAVGVLVRMLVGKCDAPRSLRQQEIFLLHAVGLRVERFLDVPFVHRCAEIVKRARMTAHRAEDRRYQQIPCEQSDRNGVANRHASHSNGSNLAGEFSSEVS